MGDNQKIHPVLVDTETAAASPTPPPLMVPLAARGSSNLEKGDPIQGYPAFRRTINPVNVIHSNSKPLREKRSSCCCCKCICWTISLLILLLLIIGITCGLLYLLFQPKLPKYSINRLRISDLRLNADMSLYAKFNVKITADNPNKKIGIYYEKGSELSVWYTNTKLCQGSLPRFYQGHQNTTLLDVALTGQTQYGRTLLGALQEQQQTGRIPLDLKVDVPVSVKLGKLKLRKVRILGNCKLIVDSLSANNLISIKTSTCKFRMAL